LALHDALDLVGCDVAATQMFGHRTHGTAVADLLWAAMQDRDDVPRSGGNGSYALNR